MNHIDEFMLDLLNNQNQSILEILRKKNSELKKVAFQNYHYVLLKKWLFGLAFVGLGVLIGLLTYLVPTGNLITGVVSTANASAIDNLAKTLIAPSITMNVLFITFIPVIGFFFLSEIKEMEKESKENSEEIAKS